MKASDNNKRLFVGSLPKDKCQSEVFQTMKTLAAGVESVIMYPSQQDKTKNRGYAFVEFDSHESAVAAREQLQSKPPKLWGYEIKVDWAEPENEVDDETMSKVKILFVRNLHAVTSEESLRRIFSEFGPLERVRKQNDYAFVHFAERRHAEEAMKAKNNTNLDDCIIEVLWSKPVKDPAQYRLKRGDRYQASNINALNPLQAQLQFVTMQSPLLHSPLLRPTPPPLMRHGMEGLLPEGALPLSYLNPFNMTTQQTPSSQFTTGFSPSSTTSSSSALLCQASDRYDDEATSSRTFNSQALGNAPGALRTSVSPHVQTRPYPAPNTVHHLQQQQQVAAMHSLGSIPTVLPQTLPMLPQTQSYQVFPAGNVDYAALGYYTVYPNGPVMPLMPAAQGHDYFRQGAQQYTDH